MNEALALIEEIGELLEATEGVHHKAPDFFESLAEKVASIEKTIRGNKSATPNQVNALRNMRDGVARWHHEDD